MLLSIPWWLPAFVASIFNACSGEVNRRYKMGGRRLTLWVMGLSTFFLSPFALYFTWPTDYKFYIVAVINGMVMAFASVRQLRLAADFNGRIAGLVVPFKVLFAFIIWVGVSTYQGLQVFDSIYEQWIVSIALTAMVFSFLVMASNKMNWHVFDRILPISLFFAMLDVAIKLVMADDLDSVFIFVFVAFLSAAISIFGFMVYRGKKKVIWTPDLLKAGTLIAICGTSAFLGLILSIQLAENPAYPAVLVMFSCVWLFIYHRVKKIPDDLSPVSGITLVFCAIVLVLVTRG